MRPGHGGQQNRQHSSLKLRPFMALRFGNSSRLTAILDDFRFWFLSRSLLFVVVVRLFVWVFFSVVVFRCTEFQRKNPRKEKRFRVSRWIDLLRLEWRLECHTVICGILIVGRSFSLSILLSFIVISFSYRMINSTRKWCGPFVWSFPCKSSLWKQVEFVCTYNKNTIFRMMKMRDR